MTLAAWRPARVVLFAMLWLARAAVAHADCSVIAASAAVFSSATSFAVGSAPAQTSTTNAGLHCSGAVLSVLQTGDHLYATITSANSGLKGPSNDVVPYTMYADGTTTYPIARGVQFDYATGSLLNLLGLFGGPGANLPLYFRTTSGANVAAGTYTDTVSIAWSWNYCRGIGLFGVCIGRDIGSGSSSFQISMEVTTACQITAAPNVSFGQAANVTGFGPIAQSLAVLCTKGLATYTVGVSTGQHAGTTRRRMASGAHLLEYDLFKPGGSTVWSSAGAARVANSVTADGATSASFPYSARIYTDQATPAVGVYSDILVIDVVF